MAGNLNHVILPVPLLRRSDNGSHAGNKLAFQGYFIIPVGAETFAQRCASMRSVTTPSRASSLRKYGGHATLIADVGSFAPHCDAREEFEFVLEAIEKASYKSAGCLVA